MRTPLKKELRKEFRLALDIHGKGWFLDRMMSPADRAKIAEAFAREIVDPFLSSEQVVESKAPALTEFEAKAAVLHLQLQWEDDTREKGLTKLCYEALVKSVLRETSSERRVKIDAVREAVRKLLPSIPPTTVDIYVNSALERLDKRAVRTWRQEGEVCLTHEEVMRVREGLANKEVNDTGV